MLGWLRGRLLSEDAGASLIDVNGVGYEVCVPVGALARAQTPDGNVELFVHTHVREDSFELFGFAREAERRVFRQLLAVPNVGPRTALGVLSALPVEALARAVGQGDLAALSRVPGIGKKTAERLVLELKGKLVVETSLPAPGPPSGVAGDAKSRLLSALTNMGYRPSEAERAVASLGAAVEEAPMGELLKQALARLG